MQKQPYYFCEHWISLLIAVLPGFVGICFTADEVEYILHNLKCALASDDYMLEPMIFRVIGFPSHIHTSQRHGTL